MFRPSCALIPNSTEWAAIVVVLLFLRGAWAQQSVVTAEQVLDKYAEAVGGAGKFAAISTWYEKFEVTGDLTDYIPSGRAPTPFKSHGNGESYFKAPNFRVGWVQSDGKDFVSAFGCDGKESWGYAPRRGMEKWKPRTGQEYGCRPGMSLLPIVLLQEKAKLEFKGQKDVAGRSTFVIHAELPDQRRWNLYFDRQNYMLLRVDYYYPWHPIALYSDYRDVAGLKVPFRIERQSDNTDEIFKLQAVQVNMPIDDQVFRRPNW